MTHSAKQYNKIINEWRENAPDYAREFIDSKSGQTADNTLKIYVNNINIFWSWLNDHERDNTLTSMVNVQYDDANLFMKFLSDKFSTPTVLAIISTVSSLYSFMLSEGYVMGNPFLKIKRPKQIKEPPIILSDEDKMKFLESVTTGKNMPKRFLAQELTHDTRARNIAMTKLLLTTGIKVSELVSINTSDISFINHTVSIKKLNGKSITVTIDKDTETSIKDCLDMRIALGVMPDEPALFTSSQGKNKGKRISIQTVDGLIKKYAIAAELPCADKMNPNRLRYSCIKGGD